MINTSGAAPISSREKKVTEKIASKNRFDQIVDDYNQATDGKKSKKVTTKIEEENQQHEVEL